MVSSIFHSRNEILKALLDMFTEITELPVGMFECADGELTLVYPENSETYLADYCKLIWEHGGRVQCEVDQCRRVKSVIDSQKIELSLCHAGLYNQAIPIMVEGEPKSILLYGEMLIDDEEHLQASLKKHEEAMSKLNLDEDQQTELSNTFLATRKLDQKKTRKLEDIVPKLEQFIRTLITQANQAQTYDEKIAHEIMTRLQALMTVTDNLRLEMDQMSAARRYQNVNRILQMAKVLRTAAHRIGKHQEAYDFKEHKIIDLVEESIGLFRIEADVLGIDIRTEFDKSIYSLKLPLSYQHMEFALNNLVHNMVKYSYRGTSDKRRYVTIKGSKDRDRRYYILTFENYGVGILPEEIEQNLLFKEGYQGKLTKGEYRAGLGLGLYHVKRIIDEHQGLIEVSSEPKFYDDDDEEFTSQPHLNQFSVYLPYVRHERGA